MTIRIIAAAIKLNGTMYALAPPARHDTVLRDTRRRISNPDDVHTAVQGFVDSSGRFHHRLSALRVARESGQCIREPISPAMGLSSEEVW